MNHPLDHRLRTVHTTWASRASRHRNDPWYSIYVFVTCTAVFFIPLAWYLWHAATHPLVPQLFGATHALEIATWLMTFLLLFALVLGRYLGPLYVPPFLLHTLLASDLPRSMTLRRPVLRATAAIIIVAATCGGLIGLVLLRVTDDPALTVIAQTVSGAAFGVILAVAYLVGQVAPRIRKWCIGALLTLSTLRLIAPEPNFGFSHGTWVLGQAVALALVAPVLGLCVPRLLEAADSRTLVSQAVLRLHTLGFASSLEFSSAVRAFQDLPTVGRGLLAIQPKHGLVLAFLWRGAVGALRTPFRLVLGLTACTASGVLMSLALSSASGHTLSVAAALLLFIGLGPLTDGVRYAASATSAPTLFGVGPLAFLLLNAVFPALASASVTIVATVVTGLVTDSSISWGIVMMLVLCGCALLFRTTNAFKGPLPAELLTPMLTPMGDVSIAVQLLWACDGVILMALCGVAVLTATSTLAPFVGVISIGLALFIFRFRGGS